MNEEEIIHLAELANLKLSDEEIKRYTKDMQDIINFANQINNVDTDGVEISATALDIYNVFRKDEIKESYNRDDLIKNCASTQEGMFSIPNAID